MSKIPFFQEFNEKIAAFTQRSSSSFSSRTGSTICDVPTDLISEINDMATTEGLFPKHTGIDKLDHMNQKWQEMQNPPSQQLSEHFKEMEANEPLTIQELEKLKADEEYERQQELRPIGRSAKSVALGVGSSGVAMLLAALAMEKMTIGSIPIGRRGKVINQTAYDGKVKRSTLTREDFPSRQAWRAHQREQEKAWGQGRLYG